MTPEDKLDKLLEDVAVIRTKVMQHEGELDDLKAQLKPISEHVASLRFVAKLIGAVVGIAGLVVGILELVWR